MTIFVICVGSSLFSKTADVTHIPPHPVHTAAHCNPLQLSAANYPVHIQCTHTAAAITSLEHIAANLQCQLQPSTTIYTTAILSSAHCSYTIQCTLQLYYPVHTAVILSSVHCSYTIQCTLQLYYPVHTAATLSGANTIQCIQCISGSPQGKPIPLLAYIQSSQQTLIQWLTVAVPKMKKTG